MAKSIKLYGRVILSGNIRALSGLRVGGSPGPLAIGNVDLPVIRDPVTRRPYIPGSSLRGKMRSLSEKHQGKTFNREIGEHVSIHACEQPPECDLCKVYGTLPNKDNTIPSAPTRLVVRDVLLSDDSAHELEVAQTDLPFTEVKWEAAIDRVTSAANPRQLERVPAGAVFSKMELVFNLYDKLNDSKLFVEQVLTALQLVEDDYLGGQGSRGSGKVAFEHLTVTLKAGASYQELTHPDFTDKPLADLISAKSDLIKWIEDKIKVNGGE